MRRCSDLEVFKLPEPPAASQQLRKLTKKRPAPYADQLVFDNGVLDTILTVHRLMDMKVDDINEVHDILFKVLTLFENEAGRPKVFSFLDICRYFGVATFLEEEDEKEDTSRQVCIGG